MRLKILGKLWNYVEACNLGDARGKCEPPDEPGKRILILKSLRGEERMEVLIHEATHAAGWHIDEAFVKQYSKDVARMLTRLGYRRDE